MGKTAKAKVAKAKAKIARKMKRGEVAAIVAALALSFLFAGCSTSDSAQPAKSATMNNTFDDCVIIVAAKAKLPLAGTNKVIEAEGGNLPNLELFTQTQSLESTGSTETYTPTATQTPTTDIKPDVDLHYNDAIGAGGSVGASFVNSLTAESAALLKSYIDGKKTGKVTVTTKDGTTETLDCADGTCTTSSGTKITAADCAACTDCAPK